MASTSHIKDLEYLRQGYIRVEGKPFKHFQCPMLMVDEQADLCLGHVVNGVFKKSAERKIVQRKDIDGWYGAFFEPDFTTLILKENTSVETVLADPELSKKLKPKIVVEGETVGHYLTSELPIKAHTPLVLESSTGDFLKLALKKTPTEVEKLIGKSWGFVVEMDCRLPAVVSLIKAAYLSLFWMFGYKYAHSLAGMAVGYYILGRFYRENVGKSKQEILAAAENFFQDYAHMVRPATALTDDSPKGTIEDNRAFTCFGSSGRPFALGIFVRTNNVLHCVLMPAFGHHDAVKAYDDFLKNDKETLVVSDCLFDEAQGIWQVSDKPAEIAWLKKDPSFNLASQTEFKQVSKPPVKP